MKQNPNVRRLLYTNRVEGTMLTFRYQVITALAVDFYAKAMRAKSPGRKMV
jgi:hypothetical protein